MILGFQHDKDSLFPHLRFTCLVRLPHLGPAFTSRYDIPAAWAVGTEEGTVLIVAKGTASLDPVCLLVGHKTRVTGVAVAEDEKTLLSVDADGCFSGWDIDSVTCKFMHQEIIVPGHVSIAKRPGFPTVAWIWTTGMEANLVDIATGGILLRCNLPGLRNFGMMSSSMVVCVAIRSVKTYELADDMKSITEKTCKRIENDGLDVTLVPTEFGVVRYKKKSVWLETSDGLVICDRTAFGEMDTIASVYWKTRDVLCVGSYTGTFRVYRLTWQNKKRPEVEKMTTLFMKTGLMKGVFSFCDDFGFVAIVKATDIATISMEGEITKLNMKGEAKLADVPEMPKNELSVVEQGSEMTFHRYNWRTGKCDTVGDTSPVRTNITAGKPSVDWTHVGITSMISVSRDARLEVVVGASNGSIYFYLENQHGLSTETIALNTPVIGLAALPVSYAGRPFIVAIGSDGSCVILKWTRPTWYQTPGFPIVAVRYIETQRVIELQTSDGSFSLYCLESVEPIQRRMEPIVSGVLVWSASSRREVRVAKSPLSICVCRVGSSCMVFGMLHISSDISSTGEYDADCLIYDRLSLARESDEEPSGLSWVFVGAKHAITIFFPSFRLGGPTKRFVEERLLRKRQ